VKLKLLHSKRNRVYLVCIDRFKFIAKYFVSSSPDFEEKILRAAVYRGVKAPNIIYKSGDVLFLEYLNGENFMHLLNSKKSFKTKAVLVDLLFNWLYSFHSLFSSERLIKGDCNLRNFILYKNLVYGVDFDSCRTGDPVEDYLDLCVSILSSSPMFTPLKYRLCGVLINKLVKFYSIDPMEAISRLAVKLGEAGKRRNSPLLAVLSDKFSTDLSLLYSKLRLNL